MNNKIMLITYADSLGSNLAELEEILDNYYEKALGSVHILPFFPSSGDRGFAPLCYDKVDPAFGDFTQIKALGKKYELMFDFMVNHISRASDFYQDFKKNKENSPYKEMFLRYEKFWSQGEPSQAQVDLIYKRKPKAPYEWLDFDDGTREKMWCTFGEEQMDLDVSTTVTKKFIEDTVKFMCENGASVIRLDAFAYAIKKEDTSCFFVEPDMWNLLQEIQGYADEFQVRLLPEIHEHYSIQEKIAEKGYCVYDFALPMLVLHALFFGEGQELKAWLDRCPRNQMTTLDTHDGIGVVDVVDLLSQGQIEKTQEVLYSKGANVKKKYSSEEYNNLDIYQMNCTYYSALGNNDDAYLAARAIQFFAPGVPQVYYVGMLAGENDLELLESTKEGRNINRHYYKKEEIEAEFKRPVVVKLRKLMEYRNENPAFLGECLTEVKGSQLVITREYQEHIAVLSLDLKTHAFEIKQNGKEITLS